VKTFLDRKADFQLITTENEVVAKDCGQG